ncbi:hypothetical protein VQ042_00680 [Aurantimonas sp. A2-1-M11]|uniref:hypothetical protein n=1 Tax=Aurantimonas sp. A2-1-M11 TaxID=3113712 RepID=UPI002F94FBFA
MRIAHFVLFAATILSTASLAQTSVTPDAGGAQPPAAAAAPAGVVRPDVPEQTASSGGPANICGELVAFLTPSPEPAEGTAGSNGQPAAAQAGSDSQPSGQPETTQAAAGQQANDGEQPVQAADESGGDEGSAQDASNQAGAAVEAPVDSNAPADTSGNADNAPQTSGLSAPIPSPTETTEKRPDVTLAEGRAMAEANDLAKCHSEIRRMRRAGIEMPPELIALAALDLRYHQQSGRQAPEPAVGEAR